MGALPFQQWLSRLRELTIANGVPDYLDGMDHHAWADAYEDGMTPEEAWAEEKYYAAQDAG